MTLDEYQQAAKRTYSRKPGEEVTDEINLAAFALGLSGEAGEVADLIKKRIAHGHKLDVLHVMDELGDCLWYVAALCTALGVKLDAVASMNVDKLTKRYPDGFTHDASRNREG